MKRLAVVSENATALWLALIQLEVPVSYEWCLAASEKGLNGTNLK